MLKYSEYKDDNHNGKNNNFPKKISQHCGIHSTKRSLQNITYKLAQKTSQRKVTIVPPNKPSESDAYSQAIRILI